MSEIISIHIGQPGNYLGGQFLTQAAEDHCISAGTYTGMNPDFELAKTNVYFDEVSSYKFKPRAILVDSVQDWDVVVEDLDGNWGKGFDAGKKCGQ